MTTTSRAVLAAEGGVVEVSPTPDLQLDSIGALFEGLVRLAMVVAAVLLALTLSFDSTLTHAGADGP